GRSRGRRPGPWRDARGRMARQAGLDHAPLGRTAGGHQGTAPLRGRSQFRPPRLYPRIRQERIPVAQARPVRLRGHLHPSWLLAHRRLRSRPRPWPAGLLGRRPLLPLPRLHPRPFRSRVQKPARARQPRSSPSPTPARLPHHRRGRRRQQGPTRAPRHLSPALSKKRFVLEGAMMAGEKTVETTGLLGWLDRRFPVTSTWKAHLSEYYAPKNFNFWYFFGSLALLVLVIQIVTGIFLVMHYKPDAERAFLSVEYIM